MLMTECSPSRKRIEKILAKNQPKSSAVNEQTNFFEIYGFSTSVTVFCKRQNLK